jgi:hypothetical protein
VRATPDAIAAELNKMADANGPVVAMSRHLDIWAGVGLRVEMDQAEILFTNGAFLSVMLAANHIRAFSANAKELVSMFKLTAARFATSRTPNRSIRRATVTTVVVDGDGNARAVATQIGKVWTKVTRLGDISRPEAGPESEARGLPGGLGTPLSQVSRRAENIAVDRRGTIRGPRMFVR